MPRLPAFAGVRNHASSDIRPDRRAGLAIRLRASMHTEPPPSHCTGRGDAVPARRWSRMRSTKPSPAAARSTTKSMRSLLAPLVLAAALMVAPAGAAAAPTRDRDGDGLTDRYETKTSKTDPLNPDTDGDGLSDGAEVLAGYDPLDPNSPGAPTPADTTPPTVWLMAPADGSTVTGSVALSAGASDGGGSAAGVQFQVDGQNVGQEDTTEPYTAGWDTTTLANGWHSVRAVARDSVGNTSTSVAAQVSVSNVFSSPSPPSAPPSE